VLAELRRICRPGGWLHVLSEDYGMLYMPPGRVDPDRLWHEGVIPFARNTGTDARVGRRTWSLMNDLGLIDLRVDDVIVDTVRVSREVFAAIMEAWRDGYTDALARHTALSASEVRDLFDYTIETIRDPKRYAAWHIPVVSGRKSP
jgi:hypothetical protein